MAKDDLTRTFEEVRKEVEKQSKHLIAARKATLEEKGYTAEQIEKQNIRMIDRMAKDRKVHAEKSRRLDWEQREKALQKELLAMKGMNETEAKTRAQQVIKAEKAADDKRLEREKTFFGRFHNTLAKKFDKGKGSEERIEALRQQKGFFKSLTSIFKGKKDGDDKGGGMFGKMFKTVKKVFKMISAKFLLIGALVVGLISQMNLDQLKEVWKGLKEAFTAIWEFLEPVIDTIWNWIKESAIPALVDYFIIQMKGIGDLFSKLKERFSGFSEMTWGERITAIFGSLEDIVKWAWDAAKNLLVLGEKLLGGDGTFIADIWDSIGGFFGAVWDWIKLLFTDPVAALDKMIMGTAAMLVDFAKWMHEVMIVPLVNWFKETFSLELTILEGMWTSLLEGAKDLGSWLKLKLLDPAVEWLGTVFGFDSGKFKKFSIGELFSQSMKKVVDFFSNLFDVDFKELFKPMILALPFGAGKAMWKMMSGEETKKPASDTPPPADYSKVDQTQSDNKAAGKHATIDSYMRSDEYKQLTGGKGKSKKFLERAYEAHLAAPARTRRSATPEWLKKKRAKRLMHKRLAEQHRAGKSGELAQIQADEGFEPSVYKDTMGIKTIGYGFNLERAGSQEALEAAGIKKSLADLKGGKTNLTKEEASRLMMGEMGHFQGVAKRFVGESTWKKLSPNRQGILTNMAYNMGEGTLSKFKDLKAAIQRGDWSQAQAEMKNSAWAGQVKGRADRLIARMGGEDKNQAFAGLQNQNSALKTSGSGGMTVTPVQIDQSQHNTQVAQNIGVAGDAKNPKMQDTVTS